MIEIKNLVKYYDSENVLENVNLKIEDNTIFGLVGKSGAGKSTLLNCIVGWEKYQSGSIKVDDIEVEKLNNEDIREFRKDIGMIFQNFCLLNRKTVYENIAFPMRCWNVQEDEIDKRTIYLAKVVGLADKLDRRPFEVSGGEKQRVAIARALTMQPKYLLCDEATSSLDPKTTDSILSLLRDIKKELGISVIIITHEMEVVEKVCDVVGILDCGKISEFGTVKEIFLDKREALNKFTGRGKVNFFKSGINISLNINKDNNSDDILWKLGNVLKNPYKIVDSSKYEFVEGDFLNVIINISKEDKEVCFKCLDENNIDYRIGVGE